MAREIILASGSGIRAQMLSQAGIPHRIRPARVDEAAIRDAMLAEEAPPRDIADKLAEVKALKVSAKEPGALVLGCDQVLEAGGRLFSKPETPEEARRDLAALSGGTHRLLSAAVICEDGEPVWRHVGVVRLTMRQASDAYLDDYVARNWESIRHSVGGYKLEEEGVRLFARIEGDYFTVLGLPLLELIGFLTIRGDLEG
ncbi:septum formation protein Maf [Aquicoccus sp. SCR17]|nr:septum formation protein Maf [Carideicomes alvinocaridis]